MGLTGLVILYLQPAAPDLEPVSIFSTLASWCMDRPRPSVLGVVVMFVCGSAIRSQTRSTGTGKRGGLCATTRTPGPGASTPGQKIVFWGVVLGAVGLLASGLTLMFPFYWLGMDGMQWTQLIHAAVGLAMIALIIGHIYIGTIGMKGPSARCGRARSIGPGRRSTTASGTRRLTGSRGR